MILLYKLNMNSVNFLPQKLSNLRSGGFSALSVNQEAEMGMKSLKNKQPRKGSECWGLC